MCVQSANEQSKQTWMSQTAKQNVKHEWDENKQTMNDSQTNIHGTKMTQTKLPLVDMTQHGTTWHNMSQHDTAWLNMTNFWTCHS